MPRAHISDHDLERFYLGMITAEDELARIEEHLLACPECVERARVVEEYVDAMRRGIIRGDFDEDDPEKPN